MHSIEHSKNFTIYVVEEIHNHTQFEMFVSCISTIQIPIYYTAAEYHLPDLLKAIQFVNAPQQTIGLF